MGLIFILTGLFMASSALIGLLIRPVREVEQLPDAVT
jgi:hypothetical protein